MMQNKQYTVRLTFVLLFFITLFFFIGIRLYFLQIKQQHHYRDLSAKQYQVQITLQPSRGIIYDRSGKIPLALNREVTSCFILPHQLSKHDTTLSFVKHRFPNAYKQIMKNPGRKFIWLKRKLSQKQYAYLKKHQPNDIHFLTEPQRYYPFPASAHLIGFTNIDNNGIAGMELILNDHLRGIPTILALEKDARAGRFYFKKEIKRAGIQGKSINLTIDSTLQNMAAEEVQNTVEAYKAQAGAALIIDPTTGELLAMVSYPLFNPNEERIADSKQTKNIPITECYEFGSIAKTFSALASLEENVVTLDEEINCCGKYAYFGHFRVENWKAIDIVPFADVVKYSSNVGIAKVAMRLGPKLYEHLRKLGFGSITGIEFPGERSGFVMPPEKWSKSSILALSFGYEIAATLLQLAGAFCIIANDGYAITPTLLQKADHSQKTHTTAKVKQLYRTKTIEKIKTILEPIAHAHRIEGFRVMGKTGTARLLEDGIYSTKRHIYTFAGIVEKGSYKRVIVTFIKEPKKSQLWASQVTGPLFGRIARHMVTHDHIKQIV